MITNERGAAGAMQHTRSNEGNHMRRSTTLESRLNEWAKEYGGGRYEQLGSSGSWLASMIRWGGRAPQGMEGAGWVWTAADDVQEAIEALEKQPHGYAPAMVIRAEYLTPGQPRIEKMRRLRRLGIQLDTTRFSQHLRLAKVHVAGWLRIPFEEPLNSEGQTTDENRIDMLEFIVGLD